MQATSTLYQMFAATGTGRSISLYMDMLGNCMLAFFQVQVQTVMPFFGLESYVNTRKKSLSFFTVHI